ncbi:MAG: MBL fold metallo-hydrolase [Robiginitomaculum sp.]
MKPSHYLWTGLSILALMACSNADVNPKAQAEVQSDATAQKPDAPAVTLTDLGNGLYMLEGKGGNVGVAIGPDKIAVIDDQYAVMSAALLTQIKALSGKPIAYMINTHYHGDHTGGNIAFSEAGAVIIAHDNVHKRMSQTQKSALFNRPTPPSDKAALPHLSYSEQASVHMDGQRAIIIHVKNGHTDGDSLVHFPDANVIHMGDNFFHGLFPYIDTAAGGSLDGMIDAHSKALSLANEATQIIPGHGPLASTDELRKAQAMLIDVRARVQARIDAGDDMGKAVSADPLAGLEAYVSFIDKDNMVRSAYASLTAK